MFKSFKILFLTIALLGVSYCAMNTTITPLHLKLPIGDDINTLTDLNELFNLDHTGFVKHLPSIVENNQFKEVEFNYPSETVFQGTSRSYNPSLLGDENAGAIQAMLNKIHFSSQYHLGNAICLMGDMKTQVPNTSGIDRNSLMLDYRSIDGTLDSRCPFNIMPHNVSLNLVFYYTGTNGKPYHFTFPFKIVDNQTKKN